MTTVSTRRLGARPCAACPTRSPSSTMFCEKKAASTVFHFRLGKMNVWDWVVLFLFSVNITVPTAFFAVAALQLGPRRERRTSGSSEDGGNTQRQVVHGQEKEGSSSTATSRPDSGTSTRIPSSTRKISLIQQRRKQPEEQVNQQQVGAVPSAMQQQPQAAAAAVGGIGTTGTATQMGVVAPATIQQSAGIVEQQQQLPFGAQQLSGGAQPATLGSGIGQQAQQGQQPLLQAGGTNAMNVAGSAQQPALLGASNNVGQQQQPIIQNNGGGCTGSMCGDDSSSSQLGTQQLPAFAQGLANQQAGTILQASQTVGGATGASGTTMLTGTALGAAANALFVVNAPLSAVAMATMQAEMKARVDAWFAAEQARNDVTAALVQQVEALGKIDYMMTAKCGGTYEGWKPENDHQGGVGPVAEIGFPGACMNDNGNGFRQAFGSLGGPAMFNGETIPMPPAGNIGLTFDVEYAFMHGMSLGIMHYLHGGNYILGPGAQVWHDPYGGRLWEYMPGEDPIIGTVLAAAYAIGPKLHNVGCTWKHYVCQDEESNRFSNNVQVPKEGFFDIYWKPFVGGISVGGQSVMCGYSWIWGKSQCVSDEALGALHEVTDRMFIVSDWGATGNSQNFVNWMGQKYEGDNDARKYTAAGLDAEQPTAMAVNQGNIGAAAIEDKRRSVHRILASVQDIGYGEFKPIDIGHRVSVGDAEAQKYGGKQKILDESKSVAIALAAEAMVLLKNEGNLLPLKQPALRKIVNCDIDPRQGITRFLGGLPMNGNDFGSGEIWQEIPKVSDGLKSAGITVGAGEASLVCLDERSAEGRQRANIDINWKDGGEGKLIVFIGCPGQVRISQWLDRAAVVIATVYSGYGVGPGIAQVLLGKHNPHAHLSFSIVRDGGQIRGAAENYAETDGPRGDLVGYRRLQKDKNAADFEFGAGLCFEGWENFAVTVVEHNLSLRRLSFCVTNNNNAKAADELPTATVQFYAQQGDRPYKELLAFRKVKYIAPGEMKCSFVFYDPVAGWDDGQKKFVPMKFNLFVSLDGYTNAVPVDKALDTGSAIADAFDRKGYWRYLRERYMYNAIQIGAPADDEIAQHMPFAQPWAAWWQEWVQLGQGALGQDLASNSLVSGGAPTTLSGR
ncbi:unnamed protein product [Amoebophrya sp. A120]|nr:unnamed protein product [Amoebophrya sp. A120]|eukprot:GSA120T00016073001.1